MPPPAKIIPFVSAVSVMRPPAPDGRRPTCRLHTLRAMPLALVMMGCTTSPAPGGAEPDSAGFALESGSLELSGAFHVVWNGLTRYFLVDDAGNSRELLVDDELLRQSGGPVELNGKQVDVTGRTLPGPDQRIRVFSIEPPERRPPGSPP